MDEEEDDDIYAPPNGAPDPVASRGADVYRSSNAQKTGEDLEEGEEEGEEVEESDSVRRQRPPNSSSPDRILGY